MAKYFVTFGDSRLSKSATRIEKQVGALKIFDRFLCFKEADLDAEFINDYSGKLRSDVRGFGYWCWKPQVILQALREMNIDDELIYVDIGCHLNPFGRQRLIEYFELLKSSTSGIVAFQAHKPSMTSNRLPTPLVEIGQYTQEWIKGDVFEYFRLSSHDSFIGNEMIGAGVIVLKKTDKSYQIIKEWSDVIASDFSLLDDSPSISPNHESFIEHRHDQSIFTILCLKHKVDLLSAYEYFYPKAITSSKGAWRADWDALKHHPIHAKKDLHFGDVKSVTKQILHNLGVRRKW